MKKLPLGSYTLKEVETPAGYVTAADITFEVVDSAKLVEIIMEDDITTTKNHKDRRDDRRTSYRRYLAAL